MDSNKGNLYKAKEEFSNNLELFKKHGFIVYTVCQHGNPIIERQGYTSNRDFFRDIEMAQLFRHISEIMVNFKNRIHTQYKYVSDAGYGWKIIFDPENNDVVDSLERDISLSNLDEVYDTEKDYMCYLNDNMMISR